MNALPPNVIARLQRGDSEAFEAVFRTYYAPLAAFAFTFLNDAAAAEDVVQEVFGALWAAHGRVVITTSLRAYLYTAVRNRSLNLRKRAAIFEPWELDESALEVRAAELSPPTPEEILDDRVRDERLALAFDTLPERQRQVMRLRWTEQLSYEEIAEIVGISVKGVEKHLSRGLAALRQYFRGGVWI